MLEILSQTTTNDLPYLVVGPVCGALVGFILGFFAFVFHEWRRHVREKHALLDLFIDHIGVKWAEVDALKSMPIDEFFSRIQTTILGVEGLEFTSVPEERVPMDDLYLYNAFALRLASLVRPTTRQQLWLCYRLVRKAEDSRIALNNIPEHQKDRAEYQRLYVTFIREYANQMLLLHKRLKEDRGWWWSQRVMSATQPLRAAPK